MSQSARSYDVFPVDNDSTDGTGNVITEIADEHPELVHACEETDIQSSYAARNTGIEHASGDVLLFLDADVWVPETWIEDMVAVLESNDYDYLGCNVEVVAGDQPNFWECYEHSLSFPVETYLENKHFAPTCALAVRREVFEEVGLFDERLESGGDKEFGQRVHRAGFEQGYAEDVTASHPARESWDALRSKALRIGRGRAQKRRYHPEHGDTHPLHPINVLPPSPFRLRRRFSGQDVSLPSLVGFYLLEYVLKLTQSYGMLRETLAQRQSKREEP
ncbi:sugar transferase-like protein [Natronobacterium gregoryi SP2]|uniref:Sugar transferase-like protein n=1 Tax=Natronobacterium gregoryi (strain ATCC 43098 / DSM 3393 / CCM 3738 / CIP 104747 / IAM 13177 / JCM 8860 / NBRC 102187 / NCIMB 2189 / SP2) TaxID=797304 RepID=L9Y3K5_NATGS|nr:sugar transferase-like protein [Natronobacterium gregoryi SP2]